MNNFAVAAVNSDNGVFTKAKTSYCQQSASYVKNKANSGIIVQYYSYGIFLFTNLILKFHSNILPATLPEDGEKELIRSW